MKTEQLIINNRFTIDFEKNILCDTKKMTQSKLEPRLSRLLNILVCSKGEVVTREFLIREIWDNYLGASDGLNQAISFLRKLLDDGEKNIIRTIPKKGYTFNAVISDIEIDKNKKPFTLKALLIAATFLLIFSFGGYYLIQNFLFSSHVKTEPELTLKEKGEIDAKAKGISTPALTQKEKSELDAKNKAASGSKVDESSK